MASFGNSPNPWASSYDTYKDCSQGLCSIYCPQWCYIIFPPPPPSFGSDGSSTDFSPLIIAVIGILASAFILLSYYTIIAKYCRRRRSGDENGENERESGGGEGGDGSDNSAGHAAAALQPHAEGLEEGLIKAIRVHKYRKGDGLVDGTDCAVCLSEFEENEGLRLLPKCNHAFHVRCIDTWLKSHSSCPLCRANIAPFVAEESVVIVTAAMPQVVRGSVPSVVVVVDEEEEEDSRVGVITEEESSGPKISPIDHDDRTVMGRSASLNIGNGFCSDRLLVADILREEEDDEDDDDDDDDLVDKRMRLCLGIGTSSRFDDDHGGGDDQICKWDRSGALGLIRSPLAMRRSISTSRFVFTRYGKGKNSVLPN